MIKDCSGANPDDTTAILECVEEVFEMTADLVECVCEIVATIEGVDLAPCQV